MYNSDGILYYDVIVEYGADTTKIDNNALIIYNADGTVRFNPADSVMEVYSNHVRWPGYNYGDLGRIEVDQYDPTQPHGLANVYFVGTKKLAPINLEVTAVY